MTVPASNPRPLVLQGARVIAYRIFDVADAIALDRAGARLRSQRRTRLQREGAEALVFAVAPLDTPCDAVTLDLPRTKQRLTPRVSARLFDYGAISVRFEFDFPGDVAIEGLLPLCDELYDAPVLEAEGRRLVERLVATLGDAASGSHSWEEVETYTIVFATRVVGTSCADLRKDARVARLLLGETNARRLAEPEALDVLATSLSYFDDDLAVVDWNSAFVVEPSGSMDVPDVLEFATAQLLELRYYDRLLDLELGRIYDRFMRARQSWAIALVRSPYGRLARDVLRRFIELTEFTERVDNAVKIIGDFFLARVYDAAVRRFRIPGWRRSIDEKQALVARAYDLLKGEVEIQRSTLLEVIVVLLILIEVVSAWRAR